VAIKDELLSLEARQGELKRKLAEPEAPPLLHPSLSDLYREKVSTLCHALEGDDRALAGAREAIRGLIDEVALEPDGGQLRIVLKGNLAGMLRLAQDNARPSETDDLVDQIMLVAGARNQLYLEFTWTAA
jgi:site-specific DNA recombinase